MSASATERSERGYWIGVAADLGARFAEAAAGWADRVRVLGGCCGIGPEHIRTLAAKLGRA